MSRQIEVEMFAIAVGAVGSSGTGFIKHDLEIISEANILQIPVRANILFSSRESQSHCHTLSHIHKHTHKHTHTHTHTLDQVLNVCYVCIV